MGRETLAIMPGAGGLSAPRAPRGYFHREDGGRGKAGLKPQVWRNEHAEA